MGGWGAAEARQTGRSRGTPMPFDQRLACIRDTDRGPFSFQLHLFSRLDVSEGVVSVKLVRVSPSASEISEIGKTKL